MLDALDPMHLHLAGGAVKDEPTEFTLYIGLHVQKLNAQHLRLERDGMGTVGAGVVSLVYHRACLRRSLDYGVDRSL